MGERITNSERRLQELQDEIERGEQRGILEIFDRDEDEDAALTRDADDERE